jgi:hypothetical protein
MADGELLDAREAMALLGIGENDLQNLVARGDLRAFRSAGTMKFRRDDVLSLKSEKGTEPTIILPPAAPRKPGQSGILAPSGAPAAQAPARGDANQTGPIVLDEIELQAPVEEGMATQQQTVVSPPVGGTEGATIVEPAGRTGEMTVVDQAADQVAAPPAAVAPTGSGRRPAPARAGSRVGSGVAPGPAVSRVRQAAVSVARRTQTVYERKTAHPLWTALMIVTTAVMLFATSVFSIMYFHGHCDYDPPRLVHTASGEVQEEHARSTGKRIIPPYLQQFQVYQSFYDGGLFGRLPGRPKDPLKQGDPDRVESAEAQP